MRWLERLGAGMEDIFRIPPGFDGNRKLLEYLGLIVDHRTHTDQENSFGPPALKQPDEITLKMVNYLKNGKKK